MVVYDVFAEGFVHLMILIFHVLAPNNNCIWKIIRKINHWGREDLKRSEEVIAYKFNQRERKIAEM